MNFFSTLVCLFCFTIASFAHACRDPLSETHTFFNVLPKDAMSKSVVAKIEIISSENDLNYRTVTKAKIIHPFKGIKKDDVVTIISDALSSCNRDPKVVSGQSYFVAGSIDKTGYFHGVWHQREL